MELDKSNMEHQYETLLVTESANSLVITIHRPKHRNSINNQLLIDIHSMLNHAENNPNCRFIVLQGEKDLFCTGMDFQELVKRGLPNSMTESRWEDNFSADYMSLLKRFTLTPKIIISLLDGQVLAGGVGIVAASDLVLSTLRSQFSLSEALWGLLPACVIPFLIRRIGFQKAYNLTLTTQVITATEAQAIGLVDELSENPSENLRRMQQRLSRISEETIADLKSYFRKMWMINDEMETIAVSEINKLSNKTRVRSNIKNFIEHQKFPWENTKELI